MDKMKIAKICPFCGKSHIVIAPMEEFYAWIMGDLVSDAFVSLSATEREQIISGICPDCQIDIFDDEDEEELWED